jgi:hypothetical protein
MKPLELHQLDWKQGVLPALGRVKQSGGFYGPSVSEAVK